MTAYYNEYEPYAAEWLRNLIKKGLIPDGEVDTRSIVDVAPDDLRAFTQCHFFAGIGGWSHALRLAGWPDDRPVWTGSCPCQPFSVAGKGAGTDDPRHLWPQFHRLIAACRPPVVMGEQVAGKAGYGWLDGVRADLEREGYASRGADLPALAVNAPHIRQRLYWVAMDLADAGHMRRGDRPKSGEQELSPSSGLGSSTVDMADAPLIKRNGRGCGDDLGERRGVQEQTRASDSHMADADQGGRGRRPRDGDGERDGQAGERHEDHGLTSGSGEDCLDVADAQQHGRGRQAKPAYDQSQKGDGPADQHGGFGGSSVCSHMADADFRQSSEGRGDACEMCGVPIAECKSKDCPALFGGGGSKYGSFWSDAIWLTGSDGKARRSKPGLPLLAHGVSNRVGRLRAYGNAIVPPLAAEVIRAFMECEP